MACVSTVFAGFLLLAQEVTILRFVRELVYQQLISDMCLTWYVQALQWDFSI